MVLVYAQFKSWSRFSAQSLNTSGHLNPAWSKPSSVVLNLSMSIDLGFFTQVFFLPRHEYWLGVLYTNFLSSSVSFCTHSLFIIGDVQSPQRGYFSVVFDWEGNSPDSPCPVIWGKTPIWLRGKPSVTCAQSQPSCIFLNPNMSTNLGFCTHVFFQGFILHTGYLLEVRFTVFSAVQLLYRFSWCILNTLLHFFVNGVQVCMHEGYPGYFRLPLTTQRIHMLFWYARCGYFSVVSDWEGNSPDSLCPVIWGKTPTGLRGKPFITCAWSQPSDIFLNSNMSTNLGFCTQVFCRPGFHFAHMLFITGEVHSLLCSSTALYIFLMCPQYPAYIYLLMVYRYACMKVIRVISGFLWLRS